MALARQSVRPDEVIVADDGSESETARELVSLSREIPFRLLHVRQPDEGFRAARSRNNAIHLASGNVVAMLDQDTLPHRDWLSMHLAHVAGGRACIGHVLELSGQSASRITDNTVADGSFETVHPIEERARLDAMQRKYVMYACLRRVGLASKAKPKLRSCNVSLFIEDLERVNGFDEDYVGWGQEDDDLGRRLYGAGVRPLVVVNKALVSHMPHSERHPDRWKEGANIDRYQAMDFPLRCAHGLDSHPHADVTTAVLRDASG